MAAKNKAGSSLTELNLGRDPGIAIWECKLCQQLFSFLKKKKKKRAVLRLMLLILKSRQTLELLLWYNGLRIWCCHSYSSNLIPGLGTFIWCRYSPSPPNNKCLKMTIFPPISFISASTHNHSHVQFFDYMCSMTVLWFYFMEMILHYTSHFLFSTWCYVFKMHPFAFLYILFIASNYYIFIKTHLPHILIIPSPSDGNCQLLAPKQLCMF